MKMQTKHPQVILPSHIPYLAAKSFNLRLSYMLGGKESKLAVNTEFRRFPAKKNQLPIPFSPALWLYSGARLWRSLDIRWHGYAGQEVTS